MRDAFYQYQLFHFKFVLFQNQRCLIIELMQKKQSPFQSIQRDLHYRIIPQKLTLSEVNKNLQTVEYMIYLEKGMQIVGKSSKIGIAYNKNSAKFPVSRNLFDFQIINEKQTNYCWSLYTIQDLINQERIKSKQFSIKPYIARYRHKNSQNNFICTVQISKQVKISFRLLIQSTADYIMKLTAALLPDAPKDTHLQQSKIPTQQSDNSIKIQNFSQVNIANKKAQTAIELTNNDNYKIKQIGQKTKLKIRSNTEQYDHIKKKESDENLEDLQIFSRNQSIPSSGTDSQLRVFQKNSDSQKIISSNFDKISSKNESEAVAKQRKIQNYRKYVLLFIIITLIVGYIGISIYPSGKKKNKKTKRKSKL